MTNYDKQNRRFEKLKSERDEALAVLQRSEGERSRLYSILDGIMHETRRLNSEIASACEEVSKSIASKNYSQASRDAEDAFYSSGLVSSRLTFADFEINPDSISRQPRYSAGIYKKFDKARRILFRAAKRKGVNVVIQGPSRNEIEVVPAFEMVPFVLIDNAIKYSPNNQDVQVKVTDNPSPGTRVQVVISSVGPMVPTHELPTLTKRGQRGSHALKSNIPGEGIGLYLADTLIRLANGRLALSSSQSSLYSFNDVGYSSFVVTIAFKQ
ncbi:sensor histidine kinase [Marilutibacter alkalisoli]|uniref:histidine kinase n=1 Tax=Marilutibacter alkalisoli TaxID=2591633 RepID=A0A514BQG4_9GAMM|nr:ATP-binding protein [Lysobacter alkalisoli]QDH69642.1 sensor histidine kinase [Lysobacter alkalisoli]